MNNPKNVGPHCNGLCEGRAYQLEIRRLKANNRITSGLWIDSNDITNFEALPDDEISSVIYNMAEDIGVLKEDVKKAESERDFLQAQVKKWTND